MQALKTSETLRLEAWSKVPSAVVQQVRYGTQRVIANRFLKDNGVQLDNRQSLHKIL